MAHIGVIIPPSASGNPAGVPPDPPRSTSDRGSEVLRGGSGEVTDVWAGIGRQNGEGSGTSGLAFRGARPGGRGSPRRGNPTKSEGQGVVRPQFLQVGTLSTGSLIAVVGVATAGKPRRASLCGGSGDAVAGHFWDIGPAVNVLAGANPDGRTGFRRAGCSSSQRSYSRSGAAGGPFRLRSTCWLRQRTRLRDRKPH